LRKILVARRRRILNARDERGESFVARGDGVFLCRTLSYCLSGLETWLGKCREAITVATSKANTLKNKQFKGVL
jgi:hypothetical protein